MVQVLVGLAAGLVLGFGAGFLYRKSIAASKAQGIEARAQAAEAQAQKTLLAAEREADATAKQALGEAKDEIASMRREAEDDLRSRREEITRQERRMTQAEADLRSKGAKVDGRAADLEEREEKLTYVRSQLEKATELHRAQLEKIAGMTSGEARDAPDRADHRRREAGRHESGARDRATRA